MYWNGDAFIASVRQRLAGNITLAASFLANAQRESVSEPYPPPSVPGEQPHQRSGGFKASITSTEADEESLTARSGSPTNLAFWLETGTRSHSLASRKAGRAVVNGDGGMAPRPWCRTALYGNAEQINEIATQGIGTPNTQ